MLKTRKEEEKEKEKEKEEKEKKEEEEEEEEEKKEKEKEKEKKGLRWSKEHLKHQIETQNPTQLFSFGCASDLFFGYRAGESESLFWFFYGMWRKLIERRGRRRKGKKKKRIKLLQWLQKLHRIHPLCRREAFLESQATKNPSKNKPKLEYYCVFG